MSTSYRNTARQAGHIKGGKLSRLKAGAQFQQRMEKLVMTTLEASGEQYQAILPHCRGVTLRDDTLILFVTSGSWASRLRFVQTDVLAAVNEQLGTEIRYFKAKVASRAQENSPELGGGGRKPKKADPPVMSETSAEALMAAAMNEPDKELAERLARLASRVTSHQRSN